MLSRLTSLFAARPSTAEGWLARLGASDAARDQAAFLAWLEADPGHLRDYEQLKAAKDGLGDLRDIFAADLVRLRRRDDRTSRPRRGLVLAGGLAMAGVAAAVVLAPMIEPVADGRLYESAPGRITDVTLDDGSRVTLDAGSAVRVALTRDVRRVTLERGGAYFDVTHQAERPFQVAVADRRVIVTGTRFATTLAGDAAQVFLLDGRVVVTRGAAADTDAMRDGLILAPGERAAFRPGEAGISKAPADVETATAWRKRRLVFRDARLSDVISASGRYSKAPFVVADPRLDRVRITAVLPLEGEGELSDRIAELLPVRAQRAPDGRILFRAE